MIEQGRTYTYEEIKKRFELAKDEALKELENDMREAREQRGQEADSMNMFMFQMQNMLVVAMVSRYLFKEGE